MKAIIREAAYADLERIFGWIANDRPHAAQGVPERSRVL
jgi:plasmid stabilization system protein ParE